VLCCAAIVAGAGAALAGDGASGVALGASMAPSLALDGPLAPQSQAWLDEGRQALAERAARLVDPEAVRAREMSRAAYAHLSSPAASRLADRLFPALVARPAVAAPSLPAGERIVRYTSQTTASVSLPDGSHGVLESAGPIAVRSGPSRYTPMDLHLADAGNAYGPKRAQLDVLLPKHLNEGLALPGTGVSVTPVDGGGRPLQGAGGTVGGSSVIYGNTQRDTDTLARPTLDGFELYSMLRSATSPKTLRYRIGIPARARLARLATGDGVRVTKEGSALAVIAAQSAVDAAGSPVALSVSLSGHILEVSVRPPVLGARYPIAVDPSVGDEQLTGGSGGATKSRWKFCASDDVKCEGYASAKFNSIGWGGAGGLTLQSSGTYTTGSWASLNYQTQGESKIYTATGRASGSNPSGNIETYAQLVDGKETTNESEWVIEDSNTIALPPATSYSNNSIILCPKFANGEHNCNVGAGAKKNLFRFEQSASGSGTNMSDTLSLASVSIGQTNQPTIKFNTSTEILAGGRKNVLFGSSNWLGPNAGAYEIEVKDPGIGVSSIGVVSTPWSATHFFFEEGRCEGVQCFPEVKETYTYDSKLKDGEDTVEVNASNATAGSFSFGTAKIKVDSVAPITVNAIGLPANHVITNQTYKISAEATDGSGSLESSGIKSIAIGVDGDEIELKTAAKCTPGPCTAHVEGTLSAEDLGAGEHELTVVATDNAGNVAVKSYEIFARHADPVSVEPGSVDPITGQLTVTATDVNIADGLSSLGVTRTHRSRQISAGSDGPLGGAWSMSTGPVQKIERLPSEDVVLIGSDGGMTTFVKKSGGTFTSPQGDTNLALSEVKEGETTKEFILSDARAGTSTHFTLPEGAVAGPWMPHTAEGATGATGTQTYKFRTVEIEGKKITEPLEVLAPVPSGVSSCSPMARGCRALTFNYAEATTAMGETPATWGDYKGHLTRVYFTAWDPVAAKMTTVTVAQYSYDIKGRLRAEWDPRISPSLKTLYGYDSEGHLTAVQMPGQQPWLLAYGMNQEDTSAGRLVSSSRPPASTSLGEGLAPANTAAPTLSSSSAALGKALTVNTGTWSNGPLEYSYQWKRCGTGGVNCIPILEARNRSYTPTLADAGYTIVAQVTAVNTGGSVAASTSASEVVVGAGLTSTLQFGVSGTGNGQFKSPAGAVFDAIGTLWVADTGNDRIQRFSVTGEFMAAYGTTGTGNAQFKGPWGIAVDVGSNAFVSDQNNCRIEELSAAGAFLRAFGTCGSGPGQLSGPSGVMLDEEKNVWVADTGNDRLEEFTSTGSYMRTIGSTGSGNGQLKAPRDIALSGQNMYVTDSGNNRVEEFSPDGTYVAQFGTSGIGNGQFSTPMAIAAEPLSGDLYVVDDNNSRVQEFNPAGAFVTQFGELGTASMQFKNPLGIAVNASGVPIVTDSGNNRASQWWPKPAPTYGMSIGSVGSGNGQLSKPLDEAVDAMGNIWVTDSSNNRIEKFSAYGTFLATYGSFGTGHGQFNSPAGIAINKTTGNVYVTDEKNSRVEELNSSGEYIAEFGTAGSGSGQFSNPYGIAVDPAGKIWVVDASNGRVQEFTQSGTTFTVVRIVGKKGEGNGEFVEPRFIAFSSDNLYGWNIYVTDWGNNRVQEFSSTGTYITKFGTKGTGNGQFEGPEGIAADPITGALYVSDMGKNRVEVFSSTGAFLKIFGAVGTGEGQYKSPAGLAFNSTGTLYVDDFGNNRIVKDTASNAKSEPPAPPTVGTTAVTTIAYNVPIQGVGAPYAMGEAEIFAWAQEDEPVGATAIFAPDEIQTTPASDYRKASVYYLDEDGHTVNVASPGGGISTTEYDANSGVVRVLSAANRAAALAQGAKSNEVSEKLDAKTVYSEDETQIVETVGPEHAVKLSSGTEVQARERKRFFYNEGAPSEGGPYDLATKVIDGALYSGGEADRRTTTKDYSGQANLGWRLRKPTSVTTDPNGLKLVQTTIYDPITGKVVETRSPGVGPANGPGGEYSYVGQLDKTTVPVKKSAGVAIDGFENVWQVETDAGRIDEYTSNGEIIRTFGSEGSGNGQFKKPQGIAFDSAGNVWVTDTGNNRVQELSATGAFIRTFGSTGSGSGQFSEPMGIAIDSSGNVWVADRGNNRVQKFSSTGTYLEAVGSVGTEPGHFATNYLSSLYPMWLTFDKSGDLWVTDGGNNRLQEFSSGGAFMTQFGGKYGEPSSENGKFNAPAGIVADPSGNLWVADSGNNRVQEVSATGAYITKFGTVGSGIVQFKTPSGIALAESGNVWVGDTLNNRLEELTGAGLWLRNVTTSPVSVSTPSGVTAAVGGEIWQVETGANRVDLYTESGTFIRSFGSEGTGNGQFKNPQGIAVDAEERVWVTDTGNNRVQEFTQTGTFLKAFGTCCSGNGQFTEPMGIAFDSSGHIWVGDRGNNRVEEFSAAGVYMQTVGSSGTGNGQFMTNVSGVRYPMWLMFDTGGHLWVTDGGNNRVQEFSSAGTYMTQFGGVYGEGSSANGKFRTPAGIAHDATGNIFVVDRGNNRVEKFSSTGTYLAKFGENGAGPGQLKLPSGIAVDASGRIWVGDTYNNRTEEFTLPSLDSRVAQTVYYSAAANAAYPSCGEHAEWANLPCRTQPAVQPPASVAPQLPVTTMTYNVWDDAETVTSTVGSATRTNKVTYDAAGRQLTASVTSTVGTSLPTVTNEYSSQSGALVKQSTVVGGKTQAVTTLYNTLGQTTSYTDADGNTSTFKYNLDGQTEEINDGKGVQSLSYDAVTGAMTKLVDTAAGTFTAKYDGAGSLLSVGYPNGMSANYTSNAAGETTAIEYVKNTHCTEKCTWFSEALMPGIHGEDISRATTLANMSYAYDADGRLTQTQETPAGAGCKTRVYAYDTESNRIKLTTREPAVEGKCATTGGTVETHSYDQANRLIDTGVSYDTFGDTTALPAADAGGSEVLSTYYSGGQLLSQTQNGQTLGYSLDPTGRVRETVGTGTKSFDTISHYSGDGSGPAWTSELGEKWTRNIVGIGGTLLAIQTNGETPVLQIDDLQGNVVGTAALNELETKLLTTYNSTEFGVPTTSNPPRYSWGGAGGVATEMASGITNSDTSSYVPQLGRALQSEPITAPGQFASGSDTGAPYVSGMEPWVGESDAAWGSGAVGRDAARQQAAARAALEATFQYVDIDPVVYYDYVEAERVARGARGMSKLGDIADFVADVPDFLLGRFISIIEGQIFAKVNGVDALKKWFESTATALEACAKSIVVNGRYEMEHGTCRYAYHHFALKLDIGFVKFKFELINPFWTAHVSWCPLHRKGCIKISP
jgi:YD repeat-containing protein